MAIFRKMIVKFVAFLKKKRQKKISPSAFLLGHFGRLSDLLLPQLPGQHVMLSASGTVHVPEGFAGKVFDGLKVARLFRADGVTHPVSVSWY